MSTDLICLDDISLLILYAVTGIFPGQAQAKGSLDETSNEEMVEKALCSNSALRLQIFVSCTGKKYRKKFGLTSNHMVDTNIIERSID